MIRKIISRLTFLLVAVALITSGCGIVNWGKVKAPLASISRKDTLLIATTYQQYDFVPADNFNFFTNPGVLQVDGANRTIYEALMYLNLARNELVPWLAESYTANDNFTIFTLTLRQGVTWSDGSPFTCQDVKYTLEMMRDTQFSSEYLANANLTYVKTFLQGVDCPSQLTAVISLNKPDPRFIKDRLASGDWDVITILPEHIWKNVDVRTFKNLDLAKDYPVGTGPYRLVQADSKQMVYDRRNDWWGAKVGFQPLPAPRRIIFAEVDSNKYTTLDQQLIDNTIDYGPDLTTNSFLTAAAKNPNLSAWSKKGPIYGVPSGCDFTLNINTAKAPFTDKNVRLAINYAINRQEIVTKGINGATRTAVLPFSDDVNRNWLTDDLKQMIDSYQRDAPSEDMVAKYLTAAGYSKEAAGTWLKDGETLAFNLYVPYAMSAIGTVVFDQLTRAGFIVDKVSEAPDAQASWSNQLFNGGYDVFVTSHCNSFSEPLESLQDFHSRYYQPIGTNCSELRSYCRYQNAEMDKWIEQMEQNNPSSNNASYMQAVEGAVKVFLEDMPEVVLAENLVVYPVNETYWVGWPDSANPYASLFPWHGDAYQVLFMIKSAGQ